MARKPVVTKDYTVDITSKGSWTPGDYGNFTKSLESEALILQADHKKVIKGPAIIRLASGCSMSGHTFVIGFAVLSANCDKLHADNVKCFKQGCKGKCTGVFTLSSTPFTPMICTCDLEITDADQDILQDGQDP